MNKPNLIISNSLSFDEHIKRITDAKDKIHSGTFEFATAIVDAIDQLDDNTIHSRIAERLGMHRSTLSRWIDIGSNQTLMNRRKTLPSSFGVLHTLTRIEKKYVEHFGKLQGNINFLKLFDDGSITNNTERPDVLEILEVIDNKINLNRKIVNQNKLLILNGRNTKTEEAAVYSVDELISKKKVFKTFVIIPTKSQIQKWNNCDYDTDIHDDYPIANLRHTSHVGSIECLIKVTAKDLPTGLMMLSGFGFTYRNIIVPPNSSKNYEPISNEDIIIRGERGRTSASQNPLVSTEIEDILSYAELIGNAPYLLCGTTTDRDRWVLCE